MAMVGQDVTEISRSGLHAEVKSFSDDVPTLQKIPIMDAIVAYADLYSLKTFLLVVRNALQVNSMQHNLIPPFLLREAGLQVDETPKHQSADPTVDTHAIFDPRSKMRIHLRLGGILSCFETRELTQSEQDNWQDHEVVFSPQMLTVGILMMRHLPGKKLHF